MDLTKLFETQAALDQHIYEKHPELEDRDNLDWKVLALQVELGECANEWRGFKKWSHDQEPRTVEPIECFTCAGTGDENYEFMAEAAEGGASYEYSECEECKGTGYDGERNPLLEEYVDCLHFILSIGVEIGYKGFDSEKMKEYFESIQENRKTDIIEQFILLNYLVGCIYENKIHYEQTLFELINLGENLGFTWEQIEAAYYAKNKINHQRQEANY